MARAETAAHLRLKQLALFWAQQQGYRACACEVSLPNSRCRADVAAYLPGKARIGGALRPAVGTTAVFECKQARADFLKDSRSAAETAAELRALHERRAALELQLRVHYPTLRVNDSLFQEYQASDFDALEHAVYRQLLARIARLQGRLYRQTKFDTLLRSRCGNLFYVVAEEGIFRPHEIPVGWGLLVREGDRLALRAKPIWQELAEHERLGLLHRIAATGLRALNREAGIGFEAVREARARG